jgi:LPXTG-motif cell wall-anchored protein
MTALLAVGALAILLDYLGVLPAAPNGWYLLGGLVLVVLGFFVATRWR